VPSKLAETVRQRPEEILAQTLSAPPHPEATDGWSARGRRLFLIAMAAAGVILVVAGLLVTKQLAPGPGNPQPLETGPGTGLANQLLQSSVGDQPPSTVAPSINIPLPSTPTTLPARPTDGTSAQLAVPGAPASSTPANSGTTHGGTPPTTAPPTPTTIPTCGLLGQGLASTGLPLCKSSTRSTL